MSSNAALKNFEIDDFLYTEEDIAAFKADPINIFEIRDNNFSIGFTLLDNLKILHAQGTINWDDYQARNIEQTEWKKIYEIPGLQRRKPQLISTETFSSDGDSDKEFYLLIKGQKAGPYSKIDIKNLINSKNILLNDLISTNAGLTWDKLFQVDGFDRRTLRENDSLPGLPEREFFDGHHQSKDVANEEMDAITGLAYLGNLKRGKAIILEKQDFLENAIKGANKVSYIYKYILIGSVIGIIYMGYSLKSSLKSPFGDGNDEARIGEQNSEQESDNGFTDISNKRNNFMQSRNSNDFSRNGKFENRRLDPIPGVGSRGKSFADTQKFRNASREAPIDGNNDEQSYYYNDTAPMELDPVRTQISRETTEQSVGEPGPAPSGDPLFNQEQDN